MEAASEARTARLTQLPELLAAFRRLFRDDHAAAAAFEGSLGSTGLRGVAWKRFLGVLPASPDRWSDAIAAQRAEYTELKRKWLPDPDAAEDMDPTLNNPLCPVDNSPWAKVSACRAGSGAALPCPCCAAATEACCLLVRLTKSAPSAMSWLWT
jgi:hypothetical protein